MTSQHHKRLHIISTYGAGVFRVSQFKTVLYITLDAFLGVINSISRPKGSRNCYWPR